MFERLKSRFRKGTTDHDGDGKMGGSMKETKVAPKKKVPAKPKAKPAANPSTPTKAVAQCDADELAAYEQGRFARQNAIGRRDSPHAHGARLRKHWEAGWDYEDKLRT